MQHSKPPKPKATRKRLKKEILSDDFKKRTISGKILRKTLWKIFRTGKSLLVALIMEEVGTSETSVYFNETV
jgi:hypothetical protein